MENISNISGQCKTCSFFGSTDVIEEESVSLRQIKTIIRTLIVDFGVCEFISSGKKGSEKQLEDVVNNFKEEFPQIQLTLLSIYEQNTTENLLSRTKGYDGIVFPPEIKVARKTNTPTVVSYWAAEQSDYVFVHSCNTYGIAYKVAKKYTPKCLFDLGKPPRRWKNHLEKKLLKIG